MRTSNLFFLSLAIPIAVFWSIPSEASIYMKSGLVAGIYATDSSSVGGTSITISGFTSADVNGECPTNDGMVSLALREDDDGKRQLTILLASQLVGKPVRVRVDTSKKSAYGVCYLWLVERMDY